MSEHYVLDIEDYDISKDWDYLFDIVSEGEKVNNYDSMFNDPIVRTMIDKIDEEEPEEISKKEIILRGKNYNEKHEQK